jgi:hypothetical protein
LLAFFSALLSACLHEHRLDLVLCDSVALLVVGALLASVDALGVPVVV